MIDDGDKLKEKSQKGGNENTEPRPLICNLFLFLFFTLLSPFYYYHLVDSWLLCYEYVFPFFSFLFMRIRES